jgi:hypothetical protein
MVFDEIDPARIEFKARSLDRPHKTNGALRMNAA